jgi:hypothetical protein
MAHAGRQHRRDEQVQNAPRAIEHRPLCSCRKQCEQRVSSGTREAPLGQLGELESKTQRDTFLQGFISLRPVAQRRPRDGSRQEKAPSAVFHLRDLRGMSVTVCKKAFQNVFDLTESRLRRLYGLVRRGEAARENRGGARRGLPEEELRRLDAHIRSFPQKRAHYTTREVYYLDVGLNVKIMHELFRREYPATQVTYE